MVIADCNCILTALSAAGGRGHECKIYKNMKQKWIFVLIGYFHSIKFIHFICII